MIRHFAFACSLVALIPCCAASSTLAAEQAVRLTHQLNPNGPIGRRPAQLVFTIDADSRISSSQLSISLPRGWTAQDATGAGQSARPSSTLVIDLPVFAGRVTRAVTLMASDQVERGQYTAAADLIVRDSAGANAVIVAHDDVSITAAWEISTGSYLMLGLGGVILGYVLRLLLRVLSTLPVPAPAPLAAAGGGGVSSGRITRFVEQHYYAVDLTVTLVIGFFVLVALLKEGHVPASASYWYTALATGLGLGLLTNSELITKLR